MQRLPLQRVGVLKFIDQQMAHAGVQTLLHPATEHFVGEQDQRRALHVVHVDPAALALQCAELRDQLARQSGDALLVLPRAVLALRGAEFLQLALGLLRGFKLAQMGGEPVFLGDKEGRAQHREALGQIGGQEGINHRVCGLERRLGGFAAQRLGAGLPARAGGIGPEGIPGGVEPIQRGIQLGEMRHRRVDHAGIVGQRELHALGQRRHQRLVRLKAAVQRDRVFVVGAQLAAFGDRGQKRAPDFAHRFRIVFKQFVMRRQAQVVQHLQGRRAQQRGEPAVKRADLHRSAAIQRLAVELGQRGGLLLHAQCIDAACQQFLLQLRLGLVCKLFEPLLQALAHFAGRLLGEGDGENFVGCAAVEQRPQHARDQHPGLARAGTGLDRDAALRVAGNGVEGLARYRLSVVFVGELLRHGCCAGWCSGGFSGGKGFAGFDAGHAQKSLRHSPRAEQYPHTEPSPRAGIGAPAAMRAMSC